MTTPRWQAVTKIFEAAVELPPSDRKSFVRNACAGDSELESQVSNLLLADGEAGSFLENPVLAVNAQVCVHLSDSSLLQPGSVVSDRFEILRFIGQGGMGQVYEVLDHELKTRVALKALRPEISSSQALVRFRREVHLTRLITHPNVCRTFDIDHHTSTQDGISSDVTFLTMELLGGETLSALLRREGRLSTEQALPLALQMIQALSAAHAVGVVHRDFKPSNVLLVPSNRGMRAVVTDFGLARVVFGETQAPETSLTGSQGLLGTLIYMAPEQFERGEASVASDIYSLGLVLFEMVTGNRPFHDDIPFAEATKRLKQPAPLASSLVSDLDSVWNSVIARCLAPNPNDRFASVAEVTDALADPNAARALVSPAATRRASSTHEAAPLAQSSIFRSPAPRRRKVLIAAAIVVLAVSLSAIVFRHYWMKAEEAKLAEGSTVLLTNIQNSTGDKRFEGTTELVRHQILQSPYFNLMDSDQVAKTLAEMEKSIDAELDPATVREVAMRNGVRRVVFGTVSRVGDSYALDIDIERPDNTPMRFRQHWESHWTWSMPSASAANKDMPTGFLDAIRDSSDWIRHEIGESANDIARIDAPPEDVTTSNWQALSEFTQAEKFRAIRNDDAALTALHNATAADPSFALAHARLGDILVSLSRYTEGYAAYDKALALGQQRLTHRERDRISGIYASDTWDYAKAEAIFRDYTTYYPHDYLGWFYRGLPLMMMGRVEEAIESLEKAEAIDPAKKFAPATITQFDLIIGKYDDATKRIQHLRDAGYSDDADLFEGGFDFLEGRYRQSQDHFSRLTQSKNPFFRSRGYALLARLFAEQGRYKDAFDTIEKGIKENVESGDSVQRADKLLDRAYLNCRQSRYDECLEDTTTALDLDHSLQRSLSAATLLSRARYEANADARVRIAVELRKIEAQLPRTNLKPLSEIVRTRLRGEVLLAEGRSGLALEEFKKADKLAPPALGREYLARCLAIAAERAPDEASEQQMRERALEAYAATVLQPGWVWQWSPDFVPGFLSEETLSYAKLAVSLGRREEALRVLMAYASRRSSADPDSKQDREAASLLRSIE